MLKSYRIRCSCIRLDFRDFWTSGLLKFRPYFLYDDGAVPNFCVKQRVKYFGSLKPTR
jgi:hypothetical protein